MLTIELWLSDLRRVRLAFEYRVRSAGGETLVEGATVHACTDLADTPIRIPGELSALLGDYLHVEKAP